VRPRGARRRQRRPAAQRFALTDSACSWRPARARAGCQGVVRLCRRPVQGCQRVGREQLTQQGQAGAQFRRTCACCAPRATAGARCRRALARAHSAIASCSRARCRPCASRRRGCCQCYPVQAQACPDGGLQLPLIHLVAADGVAACFGIHCCAGLHCGRRRHCAVRRKTGRHVARGAGGGQQRARARRACRGACAASSDARSGHQHSSGC